MTVLEIKIANRLIMCRFLPGSFDKRFVNQLHRWTEREMTEKGRATMMQLFQKYRRQIPDYEAIQKQIEKDSLSG